VFCLNKQITTRIYGEKERAVIVAFAHEHFSRQKVHRDTRARLKDTAYYSYHFMPYGVLTLKTLQLFSLHATPEISENAPITSQMEFVCLS